MRPDEKIEMVVQLKEFKDVFTWSYKDMKWMDLKFYQHQIHLSKDVKLVAQRHYRMKPKYAIKVKEEIDKWLRVGFIRLVKQATWLNAIVVVPKKNGKIWVCVEHLDHLRMCLEKWCNLRLSLNAKKCAFGIANDALLGHIISKDGIAIDTNKVKAILAAPALANAKALSKFLV